MFFEVDGVARVLEAKTLRVNKLLYRFKDELKPSISAGGRHGKKRKFSVGDVCKVGLALWLFRAGLRAAIIRKILQHEGARAMLARLTETAAIRDESDKSRFLVAWNFERLKPSLKIGKHLDPAILNKEISVVLPIGLLFERLVKNVSSKQGG